MATIAGPVHDAPSRPPPQRLKDFGRGVTYQIAGLPIAVRALFERDHGSPEAVIRRAYAHRYWRPRGAMELIQLALALMIWPIALLGLEAVFLIKNGGAVARASHRPIHRQLIDQLRLYLTSGVLPPWYYIFELHQQPAGHCARDYIYRWESKGGVMRLLKEGDRAPSSELSDKALFAEHCRARSIPTVPVLAVFRDGQAKLHTDPGEFERDLFVKPVFGRGGKGAERWDFSSGLYLSPRAKWLTREELFKSLKERSREAGLIIQPRIINHPVLDSFNNGALSTVRILTCLDETGEPEVLGAAMRMAIGGNHTVDNLHSGGIAAAVDLATGRLGPASNLGADCTLGWMDRHPDSGARITGTKLPLWNEVCDFAMATHKAFNDRVIVGWDIAITAEGPVLVEGNGAPDLDIMQRFVRHGLMAARLGVLLAYHLADLAPASLVMS
jgi:hypothetical protein